MLNFVLFISNQRLEKYHFLLRSRVIDCLGDFEGLLEISIFVMALGQIQFVLGDFGVEFGELLVDSGWVEEVLAHVVAIGEKGHGSTPRAKLQFVAKVGDGLAYSTFTSWYLASLMRVYMTFVLCPSGILFCCIFKFQSELILKIKPNSAQLFDSSRTQKGTPCLFLSMIFWLRIISLFKLCLMLQRKTTTLTHRYLLELIDNVLVLVFRCQS